jgi:hypothetical protein
VARVVLASLLGVGQHGVGGGQLLELGLALDLVPLVAVRVVLEGQLVVGVLDGVEIRTRRELEQRVVVRLPHRLLARQRSDAAPLRFHFVVFFPNAMMMSMRRVARDVPKNLKSMSPRTLRCAFQGYATREFDER